MSNVDYKIRLDDLPLYLDDFDIFRIYLNCLNFMGNNTFEIVHEKEMPPQKTFATDIISNGKSPKIACKSKYGVCLYNLKKLETLRPDEKPSHIWILSSPFLDLKKIEHKLKIIKSKDEIDCFCLVPTFDMHLFQYRASVYKFAKNFCRESKVF